MTEVLAIFHYLKMCFSHPLIWSIKRGIKSKIIRTFTVANIWENKSKIIHAFNVANIYEDKSKIIHTVTITYVL